MTRKIKNILHGVGSLMEIAPSTNYNRFISEKNIRKELNGTGAGPAKTSRMIDRMSNEKAK